MGSLLLITNACSISYSLNTAAINYDVLKTISIKDFPNQADLVYPPLAQAFTNALKNRYIQQTRLKMISSGADLEFEGEITNYQTQELAVREDARASQTRLTVTVKVRYLNNKEQGRDLDQSFSAYRDYDNSKSLDSVQDELVRLIVDDLTDQIYNATLGNW